VVLALVLAAPGRAQQLPGTQGGAAIGAEAASATAGTSRLLRNGVVVEFKIAPTGSDAAQRDLMADDLAEVRFRITEEATGKPVRAANPGAWMDMGMVLQGKEGAQQRSCKDKVSLYMQGAVGMRPMIDLNSYFVVIMNAEASLSVVDPVVSMAGSTSTLAQINLPAPATDWALSADRKRLFVSTPRAGKVAVIDAEAFRLIKAIDVGEEPTRLALQPDGRYLWVGNDARDAGQSGVRAIDTETDSVVATIPTGAGHHELAFTPDSRYAFVSNRDAGTVSVIDVQARKKIKDMKTGSLPISMAYSTLADALYVADGRDGSVSVVNAKTLEAGPGIGLKSGLGPLRVTPDGRYALVVNPAQDSVFVIDTSSNELANTVEIKGEPFQIAFSETFAYVRSLRSERVSMIALRSLGKGASPTVQSFLAGSSAPYLAGQLAIADTIASASNEGAIFAVNPADNTTYFYMEGMNAPSSNYAVKGGSARAVTVIDRSLKEVEPGVYAGKVRLPAAGHYDVAFIMQAPQVLHCFSAEVKPNPRAVATGPAIKVRFDEAQRIVPAGKPLKLRFTLLDPATGKGKPGLRDAQVMYYLAPGRLRTEAPVKDVGEGAYEAELNIREPGAYYVYVGLPSLSLPYGQLPFFTLRAVKQEETVRPGDGKG
jgi:YVTN family beta-propeller protein